MITVFSWRDAIQKSSLESTTRLVLFNLSTYMNERGEGCFPSITTQATDTGLTEKSVGNHLKKAVGAGFLFIGKHGYAGQRWRNNEYRALFPKDARLMTEADCRADEFLEGQEPRSAPSQEGQVIDGRKVANHVPTNSPENSPISKDKKHKKTKSEKVTLAEWEEKIGADLNHQMMKSWIDEKKLCPVLVQEQIELFRLKMSAGENRYANFIAAFKNYVLSGYLPKALSALARETSPHGGRGYHEKTTRGVQI